VRRDVGPGRAGYEPDAGYGPAQAEDTRSPAEVRRFCPECSRHPSITDGGKKSGGRIEDDAHLRRRRAVSTSPARRALIASSILTAGTPQRLLRVPESAP
jgi:hypothetical protein